MRGGVIVTVLVLGVACARAVKPWHRPTPGRGPEDTAMLAPSTRPFCADVFLLTLAELARGDADGEVIAVEGVPTANVHCTALACADEACCNECSGGYVLEHEGSDGGMPLVLHLDGLGSCSGWDCNLECQPFGWKPTTRYRFVGLNSFTSENGVATSRFLVDRVCAAPP
ncbi:MAG: hypothetical protein Q8N26_17755 [Myxococcales bacterium]|nr:hypothetical protein [Myxococcales bacterium]